MMPGESGLVLCRELKRSPATDGVAVVLLSGSLEQAARQAVEAGADAYLPKPFSPLQLLAIVERLAGGVAAIPLVDVVPPGAGNEQTLMYARDLRQLLELERAQRKLVQQAYDETVIALADALATKDTGTRAHSQRVQLYALELTRAIEPVLAEDPTVPYGFLLHDVGKIGIPDQVLRKPGKLTQGEWKLMRRHTLIGEQMLGGVAFLRGEGISIVRSHHERWDGGGYPDRLAGKEIPIAARIFAVADTLDAITSDRPYRPAGSWDVAAAEILRESGTQFDPSIVDAFREREPELRRIRGDLLAA